MSPDRILMGKRNNGNSLVISPVRKRFAKSPEAKYNYKVRV